VGLSPYTASLILSRSYEHCNGGPLCHRVRGDVIFRRGAFKTGSALVNYKCNKVIYFLAVSKRPPPKTERCLQMHYPDNYIHTNELYNYIHTYGTKQHVQVEWNFYVSNRCTSSLF
jgi:hypothetical protein